MEQPSSPDHDDEIYHLRASWLDLGSKSTYDLMSSDPRNKWQQQNVHYKFLSACICFRKRKLAFHSRWGSQRSKLGNSLQETKDDSELTRTISGGQDTGFERTICFVPFRPEETTLAFIL